MVPTMPDTSAHNSQSSPQVRFVLDELAFPIWQT